MGQCGSALSEFSETFFARLCQTGDNVIVGGLIVQGIEQKRVIIGAIGPELTHYGVANGLADPYWELRDGAGALIASNDAGGAQ